MPLDAGGLILGRGGSSIRQISEESNARIQLGSRDSQESKISKERILIVSGYLPNCIKCTELVILKLQEDPLITYQNKSTSYAKSNREDSSTLSTSSPFGFSLQLPNGTETISAISTITMSVPDALVGYILGKKGATITEIQNMSGAKVLVSSR